MLGTVNNTIAKSRRKYNCNVFFYTNHSLDTFSLLFLQRFLEKKNLSRSKSRCKMSLNIINVQILLGGHNLISCLPIFLQFCNQSEQGSKSSIVFRPIRVKSRFWTMCRQLVKKLYQASLFALCLKKSTPDCRLGQYSFRRLRLILICRRS